MWFSGLNYLPCMHKTMESVTSGMASLDPKTCCSCHVNIMLSMVTTSAARRRRKTNNSESFGHSYWNLYRELKTSSASNKSNQHFCSEHPWTLPHELQALWQKVLRPQTERVASSGQLSWSVGMLFSSPFHWRWSGVLKSWCIILGTSLASLETASKYQISDLHFDVQGEVCYLSQPLVKCPTPFLETVNFCPEPKRSSTMVLPITCPGQKPWTAKYLDFTFLPSLSSWNFSICLVKLVVVGRQE